MALANNMTRASFLDEILELARQNRNDLAIHLVEITALHEMGEITDIELVERKAQLFA